MILVFLFLSYISVHADISNIKTFLGAIGLRIDNITSTQAKNGSEPSVELKAGETYNGVIKEKLSNNEAIVQIRGKDVLVKFEDGVPKGDRISIQVTSIDGEAAVVRTNPNTSDLAHKNIEQELVKILKSLGMAETPELKQALKLALSFETTINPKIIEQLRSFLSHANGSDQQKLDTILALLAKNVDLNLPNLHAIHSAINEKPLANLLNNVVHNPTPEQGLITKVVQTIKNNDQFAAQNRTDSPQLTSSTIENKPLTKQEQPNPVTQTNNITASSQSNMVSPEYEPIQALHKSVRSNMEEVINILQNLQEYEEYDYLQDFPNLPTKEFIISAVTEKLAQVTNQFKNVQREITRNLDNLQQVIQHSRGNVLPQIKPLLENTIDLIDKAILKSDITLFTDMKTEKVLLQSSSHLADARRLLAKGDYAGARQILEDVKNTIRSIDFRPVDTKVQHYISNAIFDSQPLSTEQKINSQLEQLLVQQQNVGTSAKGAFELIRALGLNYESEAAQVLSIRPEQMNQEELQRNLKATMLHLLQGDQENQPHTRMSQDVQQILSHLTGQQLLSKADTGSNLQSMLLNIPVMIGKQVENLQVIINSKHQDEKIDWENCSIYFLIETKKMGETGILLSATERNLAITLKNDQAQFREKMAPLVTKYKERLSEIGYSIKGIQYTKLKADVVETKPKVDLKQTTVPTNMTPAKGFDFKI